MKSNRLAGHTLRNEGRVYDLRGQRACCGPAFCSCGAQSDDVMHTVSARQRWHREHKAAVKAASASR
ncbi:hypothetical protein [Micromonospora sp. NPDC023633]|uniref:hypothetical protein n=1 Tax=Micromonospora sp. NPDC023633 TaxID=3154320 RepID=UPI0033F495BD